MTAPAKPAIFDAAHAPDGVEVRFVDFVSSRPMLPLGARLLLVHTNGASREGSVESAWNWAHAAPGHNTCPHYQIDRTHDGVARARKMLPSDRRGIGNATVDSAQDGHGDITTWSLVVETADLGWPTAARPDAPGGTVGFDPDQGELLARVIAYESVVHGFAIAYPSEWWGAGVGCHTEPFGYPFTTLAVGKPCPGDAKKRDMRDWIMPRAREIRAAWTAPPIDPPTSEEDDMPAIAAIYVPDDKVTAERGGPYKAMHFVLRGDGGIRRAYGPDEKMGAPVKPIDSVEHYDALVAEAAK